MKFDEFTGSLFCNVKLPEDKTWTRVMPEMAREDLGASVREENTKSQKRMASKLIPGLRECLARPMLVPADAGMATATRTDGVRPTWRPPGPPTDGRL